MQVERKHPVMQGGEDGLGGEGNVYTYEQKEWN